MSIQRKRDLLLILGLLLVVTLLALLLYPREAGISVAVSVDGIVVGTYPLALNQRHTIAGVGGENLLAIENGCARIVDADCPDHLCENMPSISHVGETIVCLPHRVILRVLGAEDHADAILQLPSTREVLL